MFLTVKYCQRYVAHLASYVFFEVFDSREAKALHKGRKKTVSANSAFFVDILPLCSSDRQVNQACKYLKVEVFVQIRSHVALSFLDGFRDALLVHSRSGSLHFGILFFSVWKKNFVKGRGIPRLPQDLNLVSMCGAQRRDLLRSCQMSPSDRQTQQRNGAKKKTSKGRHVCRPFS
jgi:hypothetical protein